MNVTTSEAVYEEVDGEVVGMKFPHSMVLNTRRRRTWRSEHVHYDLFAQKCQTKKKKSGEHNGGTQARIIQEKT